MPAHSRVVLTQPPCWQVVPQWQERLQARLSSTQSQTSQKRTQWLSSVDEDQDIITQDLITQLPQAPAQRRAAEAGSDEEEAGLDRTSPQGAAKLQQLQGVLAYAAVMPWQQPAGTSDFCRCPVQQCTTRPRCTTPCYDTSLVFLHSCT